MRKPRPRLLGLLLVLLSAACSPASGDPDAGTEPEPGTVRTLGRTGIFGDMPLENRFLDPGLSGRTYGWAGFSPDLAKVVPLKRMAFTDLPAGRFTFQVDAAGDTRTVTGYAKGGAGPLHAEVWLGRGRLGSFDGITVGLVGHDPIAGEDVTVELEPDDTFEGGFTWQRWAVDVPEGLFGWTALVVTDTEVATLYLAGPVLVQATEAEGKALRASPSRRPPTTAESKAVALFRERLRENLGGMLHTTGAQGGEKPTPAPKGAAVGIPAHP